MAETPTGRKVRVIGRIRGAKTISSKWISVTKSDTTSSLSFLDQSNNRKHTYELDDCYEPNDHNSIIFSAEIKPLVSCVFGGHCASVVAFGATASGKSYTIQGSYINPGLAVLAMEEFILMADKAGLSVSVSYYEVYQEQVYDLLNKDKNAVFVLEDAQGKIQLKGLSQAFVKTMFDFQKLYMYDSHKKSQKMASQPFRRSHKGLIINLFASDANTKQLQLVGKMNFIDLAGSVDPRRKSIDSYTLAENSRINKSLLALQSVICALNCNDSRVPYRDSKLTYMLRDTFSGTNKILMIACLNPTVCQDTVYIVNLAFRCTEGNRRVFMDSKKMVKSTQKSVVKLSAKDFGKTVTVSSSRNANHQTMCSNLKKKLTSSRLPLSVKRTNNKDVAVLLGGRKLFDVVKQRCTVEKASAAVGIVSETVQPSPECVSCLSDSVSSIRPATQEVENCIEVIDSPTLQSTLDKDCSNDTEKQVSPGHEGASPPLSVKLQELSNYLKSLQSFTPLNIDMLQEVDTTSMEPKTPTACHSMKINNIDASISAHSMTSISDRAVMPKIGMTSHSNFPEPKTPVNQNIPVNHKWDDAIISSPWTTLNVHSAGVKKCLTEECVRFINSASKICLTEECVRFINSASKEELKRLKGIGEKRATYIMKLREKSPEHFKNINDLKDVGLSAKQIQMMMKNIAGDMFD